MNENTSSLETLQDIRKIMDRSSRFISLSGFSGVFAGVFALIACYLAYHAIEEYYVRFPFDNGSIAEYRALVLNLVFIALGLLVAAFAQAFYFTWRKSGKDRVSFWNASSKRLLINLFIPVAAGAVLVLGMLFNGSWQFVVPASLLFYGLGLINASKFTINDIRNLGYLELITGSVSVFFSRIGALVLGFWLWNSAYCLWHSDVV